MQLMIRTMCLGMILLLASCSGQKPLADTAPFEAAIAQYLKANSMGMKVHQFKELKIDGASANAEVSLGHAEEATAIKVRWGFEFRQQNGVWQVTTCVR